MRQSDNDKETRTIAHDMDYMTVYQGDTESVQDSAAIKVIIRLFPALLGKFRTLQNHGYTVTPLERNAILIATIRGVLMELSYAHRTIDRQQAYCDRIGQIDLFNNPDGI